LAARTAPDPESIGHKPAAAVKARPRRPKKVGEVVPRGGAPNSAQINELRCGGTVSAPTQSLAILALLSHPPGADKAILRLSDKWALAHDDLQWILQRSNNKCGTSWRGIAFVRSTKAILLRTMRWNKIKPTPEAQAVLDELPDTFDQWLAAEREKRSAAEMPTGRKKVRQLETTDLASPNSKI
jgi:hypothetical protein